jgi:hypothetical protein
MRCKQDNVFEVIFLYFTNYCACALVSYKASPVSGHDAHSGSWPFLFWTLQENRAHISVSTQSQLIRIDHTAQH